MHHEVTEAEIDAALQNDYVGAKSCILKKNDMSLNSVKILFTSCDQLKKAMEYGIFVHPQHFTLEEFKSSTSNNPIQCFRCQQFHSTVAAFYDNPENVVFVVSNIKVRSVPVKKLQRNTNV